MSAPEMDVPTPEMFAVRPSTYAEAHTIYRRAGWTGPLPLPSGAKWPPPDGFTGWHGAYPSGADSQAWIDDYDEYRDTPQLALRMADDIIGLDVDHYGDKRGGDTLAEAARRWGALPDAPRSSARSDPRSGIRFYRVPKGTTLRTKIGFPELDLGGIEVIQRHHRYAVVWPSLHPVGGMPYVWHDTAGPDVPPLAAKLYNLPTAWIEANTGAGEPGEAAADPDTVAAFARQHDRGEQLGAIRGVLAVFERDARSGARHDAMVAAACMGAREARAGRYPASEVRSALRQAFTLALAEAKAGQRLAGPAESRREFESIWAWAVGQALAEPPDARTAYTSSVVAMPKLNRGPGSVTPLRAAEPEQQVYDAELVEEEFEFESTWRPVDLDELWDGTHEPRTPELMCRTDGMAMFYLGETHSVHGESESGKSWLTQSAAVATLEQGQRVLYVDFESDAPSIVTRLRALGMRREHLSLLDYICPDGPRDAAFAQLLEQAYHFCVIDGVTAAMASEAVKSNDQDAVTAWNDQLPKRIARRTGAAVALVDHVSKAKDERGRFAVGSQAKMANVSGSAFYVDVHRGLGQGMVGELNIYVGKDRPGGVRKNAGKMRRDRLQPFARYVHDATDPSAIAIELRPWLDEDDVTEGGSKMLPRGRDWKDPEQPPLPADIVTFTGPGQGAVRALARFMRAMAVGGDGMARQDAVMALRTDVGADGKPKTDDQTVKRAWGALRESGRLVPADNNGNDAPNGLHRWVSQPGDPGSSES